jgi:NADPH2:quinone reductase
MEISMRDNDSCPRASDEQVFSSLSLAYQRHGPPSEVLSLQQNNTRSTDLRAQDVLLRISSRPIHPGDLHIIRGLPKGGPSLVDNNTHSSYRVPGFEGVGVIAAAGEMVLKDASFSVGQRVAFFHPDARAWSDHTIVPETALLALPDIVPDSIAAQMLINTITARIVMRAGHNSLPADFEKPVYVLQTAAGSSVGRLISQLALELGVHTVRLVRTKERARSLLALLPGSPVIATEDKTWRAQVKTAFAGRPSQVAVDAVGGSFLEEIASLMEDGGTIVNFGWLDDITPDLSGFAPRELTLRGAAITGWHRSTPSETQQADLETALRLAEQHPELFAVEAEFPFSEYKAAIDCAERPGKIGTVLLSS